MISAPRQGKAAVYDGAVRAGVAAPGLLDAAIQGAVRRACPVHEEGGARGVMICRGGALLKGSAPCKQGEVIERATPTLGSRYVFRVWPRSEGHVTHGACHFMAGAAISIFSRQPLGYEILAEHARVLNSRPASSAKIAWPACSACLLRTQPRQMCRTCPGRHGNA